MKPKRTRYFLSAHGYFRRLRISVSFAIMVLSLNIGSAQDFIVNGTVNNTGTIRVKNQTVITQATVGGEIELKGADQILPAKQYGSVRLSGTGTKTTSGGDLTVQKNLTIALPVTLNIAKGSIITLGDTLFESGILKGAIQKSINLSGGTSTSNFGKIGATITWSGTAPGLTTVMRASDSLQFGNSNESVKRYYAIQPADVSSRGNVLFKFSNDELNGHDINNLQLWQSTDNGTSWRRHIPVVDTLLKTISKSDVQLNGRWTMADTLRAIGPLNAAAGVPVNIADVSIPDIQPVILATLNPYKVLITDAFGTPVINVPVTFAITSTPQNAQGDTLSVTLDSTDNNGIAQTVLTLGNKVGTYKVTATAGSLVIVDSTYANHGPAQSMAAVPITQQSKPILTQLDTAFTVTVTDIGGNPVDSVQVQFTIVNIPSGSFGHALSTVNVPTDSFGRASTKLTLGSKVSPYTVRAKVSGVSDSATFVASATVGSVALMSDFSGNNQSAVNGQTLPDPLVVIVTDIGGNPIQTGTVTFRIDSIPGSAIGQSLSDSVVPIDNFGRALTFLSLGTKVGDYVISAQSTSPSGSLFVKFTSTAVAGASATLAEIQGNNQSKPITETLSSDFIVKVLDANGNNVSDTVTFSIDTIPQNATGQSLSNVSFITDTTGLAFTRLTLGNKVGDYFVNARVNGNLFVSFKATAWQGAAVSMATISGNNQSAVIITPLQNEFVLRIMDIGGNNVPGTSVQFTIDSVPPNAAGQQLSVTSTPSGSDGTARTLFTVGNKVGNYKIKASSVGIPDTFFTATATFGTAVAIIPKAGLNQTKPILTPLDVPFAVRVVDIGDNAVPLKNVQFVITNKPNGDTSSTLNNTNPPTDSSGIAFSTLTLGSKVGLYTVKAIISTPMEAELQFIDRKKSMSESVTQAVLETTFTARATNGAAAALTQVSGDLQSKPTGTKLDTAFTLSVKDIGGNAVPGVDVTFAISSAPLKATGHSIPDTLVATDSLGVAITYLTLGNREGSYSVAAAVPGVAPIQFTANGYYIYGDPNSDIDVNIADLTMIVDQLIGKNILSEVDSIKADLDKNGSVDTADVSILRDNILNSPLDFTSMPPFIPANGSKAGGEQSPASVRSQQYFSGAKTQFELTSQGLRLNMENTVSVRGVEVRIRLKDTTVNVDKINYLFSRAQEMSVALRSANNEIRILAYSLLNAEIKPGNGTLLRIPKITSLSQIETTQVILSVATNVAVLPEVIISTASTETYPLTYRLEQNYPNPFNGATTIRYSIPDNKITETKTALHIFNVLGQRVKTLVTAPHDPGQYSVTWNGTDEYGVQVASGIYFYRLITKNFLITKKMIYVK